MAEESERRAQILEAAFEEFSAKGFKEATIKSIARVAGLQSPALIYWYFPDKEALFREVLESRIPVLRAVRDPASLLDLPPEEISLDVRQQGHSGNGAVANRGGHEAAGGRRGIR